MPSCRGPESGTRYSRGRRAGVAASMLMATLTGLISCTPTRELSPAADSDGFEAELESLQQFLHIPGLSILVKRGPAVLYERQLGYADIDGRVPVDAGTMFPIASVTKTLSTVLLLQLVQEGALSPEDPVAGYLDEFDPGLDIRIKHILSHTSEGIPGEEYLYSGRFALGGQFIEQATGLRYADLMRSRIFDRAGMADTIPMIERADLDRLGKRVAKIGRAHV